MVCTDYNPADDFDPTVLQSFLNYSSFNVDDLKGTNKKIVPFIVCGDLNGYDSDTTFPLQVIILLKKLTDQPAAFIN